MPLPGQHPKQATRIVNRRNAPTNQSGPSFRIRAPQRGNFVANIPLSMAGITDLRVKRGTSAQLQHRRLHARSKFGRR